MRDSSKLGAYLRLARLDAPMPILLLLAPCFFALSALAPRDASSITLLIKVIVGAVIVRASGCIINDLADVDFDKKSERGKSRPLASGDLNTGEGLLFLFALLVIGLLLLLTFNLGTIALGIVIFAGIVVYPFTKRFFALPQLFLGIVFASGALLCAMEAVGRIDIRAILIYIGCVAWVIGYDTIYSFQDLNDDKRMGLKSAALTLKNPKGTLKMLYDTSSFCWVIAGIMCGMKYSFVLLGILGWMLLRMQVNDFNPEERDGAKFKRLFNSNFWVAILMTIAFYIGYDASSPFTQQHKKVRGGELLASKFQDRIADLSAENGDLGIDTMKGSQK